MLVITLRDIVFFGIIRVLCNIVSNYGDTKTFYIENKRNN